MPINQAELTSEAADVVRLDRPAAAALFRALAEPTRLTILDHLRTGPHRVVDLVDHLGLAQSTVSQHLACLRECGLVTSSPEGRSSVHSLAAGVSVDQLLLVADQVVAATGAAAEHCATNGGR